MESRTRNEADHRTRVIVKNEPVDNQTMVKTEPVDTYSLADLDNITDLLPIPTGTAVQEYSRTGEQPYSLTGV